MTNLLQENIEIKSQRTIAHLVFADTQKKADPKKPKELSLPTLIRVLIDRKEIE